MKTLVDEDLAFVDEWGGCVADPLFRSFRFLREKIERSRGRLHDDRGTS